MPNTYTVTDDFLNSVKAMAADLKACKQWIANFKVVGATLVNKSNGATVTVAPPPTVPPSLAGISTTIIRVQNVTSVDLSAGSVVSLRDVIFAPTDHAPAPQAAFTCGVAGGAGIQYVAVLADAAPAPTSSGPGPLVRAYVGGVFPARVSVNSVADRFARVNTADNTGSMDSAGPSDGTMLESDDYDGDFEIISVGAASTSSAPVSGSSGDGSNLRWCFVRPRPIGPPRPTAPYQVFTPLDDSLRPVWTVPRWS